MRASDRVKRLTLPAMLSLALGCSGVELVSGVDVEPAPARSGPAWLDSVEGCQETEVPKPTPRIDVPDHKPAACDGSESEPAHGASLAASLLR